MPQIDFLGNTLNDPLNEAQVMRIALCVDVKNTLMIDIVDSNFSRGMNNSILGGKNPHVNYFSFFIIEKC